MSYGMIDAEVRYQTHEVRRQATGGGVPPAARPARAAGSARAHSPAGATVHNRRRRPGLRSRVGFTLVETGLRLLASR
jgi:hypothetical protein